MPEKLPEHIDQIEDFYKSAFSNDTEMPPPELWGKVAASIASIPPVVNRNNWKNGFIRLSVEALLISSLAYFAMRPQPEISSSKPEATPQQIPLSETPVLVEEDLPVKKNQPEVSSQSEDKSNVAISPAKVTTEKTPEVIADEMVEKKTEPEMEEIIAVPEPVQTEEVIKKEVPVVTEKQDLYSKLKKKHITDTSKSLFIEKKK